MDREHSKPQHSDITRLVFLALGVVSQFLQPQIIWGGLNTHILVHIFVICGQIMHKTVLTVITRLTITITQHNFQKFYTNYNYRNNTITGYSCYLIVLFCTAGLLPSLWGFQNIHVYVLIMYFYS